MQNYLGGVTAPEFDQLPEYVVWRSCARLLPLRLVSRACGE